MRSEDATLVPTVVTATTDANAGLTHGDPETLVRGTSIGRYVLLDRIGAGGMGVVYAAYDPQLDRRVAIKLLRVRASGSHDRLIAEAQALARLAHPNVVTVHDVGWAGERVYVAMEYVAGQTLRAWIGQEPRAWSEIVAIFAAAGRGLAAAHAVDLVHRDFKPDNVMIGDDGRVRVMDFGLARAHATTSSDPHMPIRADGQTDDVAFAGTPAYMAPEQLQHASVDARSDQFAFCVALFETLYGTRPFTGDTLGALVRAVLDGKPNETADARAVPRRIHRAVLRGLATDPDARHRDMLALVAALERERSPIGRASRWAITFGALALVGGSAFAGRMLAATPDPCGGGIDRIDDAWGAAQRERVQAHFSALPFAASSWPAVAAQLDDYAARWTAAHRNACEATYVHHEQSDALFDLRMRCLIRHADALAAHVRVLEAGERDAVERALTAGANLGPVEACADIDALQQSIPLPEGADVRDRILAIEKRLAEVQALFGAGAYPRMHELVTPIADEALAIDHAPLSAEALYWRALAERYGGQAPRAETTLREALRHAEVARDAQRVAQLWVELVALVGTELRRPREALPLLLVAELAVLRADAETTLGPTLHNAIGLTHLYAGDHVAALDRFERARQSILAGRGTDDPRLAAAHGNLGAAYFDAGRYDDALTHYTRARDLDILRVGDRHPKVAISDQNVARVLEKVGRLADARATLERVIELRRQAYGDDHPLVADALVNLGTLADTQDDTTLALQSLRDAQAIFTAAFGREHDKVAIAIYNIGTILAESEQLDEAAAHYREAIAIWREIFDDEHPRIAIAVTALAKIHIEQGQLELASTELENALGLKERALGHEHPSLAYTLRALAKVQLARNERDAAIASLQRAYAIAQAHPGDRSELGESRFAIAQAWQDDASLRADARAMAELARADFVAIDQASSIETVDAWLAAHPASNR